MMVEARVRVYISTDDVDRNGSIARAVADVLMVDEGDLDDVGQWTWIYETSQEDAWAERFPNQPLDGEPYDEDAPEVAGTMKGGE